MLRRLKIYYQRQKVKRIKVLSGGGIGRHSGNNDYDSCGSDDLEMSYKVQILIPINRKRGMNGTT